ncbi:MAG: hypothetical protein EBZ05_09470, partial [Verrucomicrobia bacterium]|nr:hypothetical protein [Verrucomicrobiota bacterium]
MRLFRPALLGELILMTDSPNPPDASKPVDSRRPGLVGLGLLAVALLGFAAGQWFRPSGPEAERLPTPSVPSVFQAPRLVV